MKRTSTFFTKSTLLTLLTAVLIVVLAACSSNTSTDKDSSGNTSKTTAAKTNNKETPPAKSENKNTETTKPAAEPTPENKLPSEVRIGYQIIPNAELLAKTLGLVEKKFPDVTVKWVQFDSGRDVNTAIASSSIDLGLAGSVPVAIGLASQLPYQVYFIHDIIGDNESLAVRKDAGITEIKDLVGKKVAVPFGSTAHFSVLSALQAAGIDVSTVSVLDLQPPDILAAWQRKDIDAAFVWQPTLAKLIADNGQVLTSAKKLAEQGIITADTGIVRTAFADEYPAFVKQYVGVLDEAIAQYRNSPEEAAKALAPILSTTEADSLAQMNELVWLTSTEQRDAKYLGQGTGSGFGDVLKKTGDFLVEQKTISTSPDLNVYEKGIRTDAIQ